jgi:hypothetical protein
MRKVALAFVVSLGATSALTGPGCSSDEVAFTSSAGVGGSTEIPLEERLTPAPGGARRLLARQYIASVRSVLGEAAASAASPPTDLALHGFSSIGASELAMSAPDVEAYEASARAIANAVTSDLPTLAALLPCTPASPADGACFATFAGAVGRRLWRRSLEPSEIGAVSGIALAAGKTYDSVEKALKYALIALLESPEFLYLVEVGEEDVTTPGRRKLTPLELATRIAFFLGDAPPDEALLDSAEKGELDEEEGVRSAAKALLERPEAKTALGAFYDEVFRFGLVDVTVKNAELYPEWTPELRASIHASVRAFLEDLVWSENADARTMLTASHAFVDSNLAPLYGVSVPAEAGLVKLTLPAEQQRMGLLGSAAFLSVFSHAAMSSPTKRGVFIRRTLLCDSVPPPPPAVVPQLPEDPTGSLTAKELLAQHMKDDNCRACHGMFDSLGWSLDQFDAIGKYRTLDKGKPIDTSGDSPNVGTFDGPKELAELLVENYQVPDCMVRNLYRNSMGHLETKGEEPAIDDLHRRFEDGGFKVQELLVELVASPAFRLVGDPK